MISSATRPPYSTDTTNAHHGQGPTDTTRGAMDPDAPLPGLGPPPASAPSQPPPAAANLPVEAAPSSTLPPPVSEKPADAAALPIDPPPNAPDLTDPPAPLAPTAASSSSEILKLARSAHPTSAPHASADLLALYSLQPLAAAVARVDPRTGAKINKLRKSYEGQLKTLGLAGRNKAVRHGDPPQGASASVAAAAEPGLALLEMAAWPAEEWRAQRVGARDLALGLSEGARARLERAMRLEPGEAARSDEWEAVLGHEQQRGAKAAVAPAPAGAAEAKVKREAREPLAAANYPAKGKAGERGPANGVPPRGSPHDGGEAARPSRTGKRRRYNDESWEGYGEGYLDDDREDDQGAYSSDGGSRHSGASRKKRRKSSGYKALSPTMSDHRGSLGGSGNNMPQIGRGIGAFGVH